MSTALQTEDRAFESLYRLNRPVIYAYALSRLRNPSDAEDVTQTTFLKAYTALHRGIAPRDEIQWLIAIARNVVRDRFRDAKRRPLEEPLEDWTPAVEPEVPEYSVGEIAKQIAGLQPRHRQILLMREFEGRSYNEISAKLGVTQPAVQALLVRARRALRDELELGITCSQARRISLRYLNGVAVRDERRALNRHLRRCTDCATFVGRRPHSVASLLLLPTLPFRKLWAIVAATSGAPTAATTAGSGGALAVKVLTLTAVGSTAVGVTVTEVSEPSAPSHFPVAPTTRPAPTPVHHESVRVSRAPVAAWPTFRASSATGRAPLTHATAQPAPQPPVKAGAADTSSVPAVIVAPSVPTVDLPPATAPAETTPAPAATVPTELTAPAEPPSEPAEASAAAAAAPTSAPTSAPAPGNVAADSPTAVSTSAPPTPPTPETSAATTASAADASASTPPVVTPSTPSSTPTPPPPPAPPPSAGNGSGNGNANGVGRGGTPPGQTGTKPEPARGHS